MIPGFTWGDEAVLELERAVRQHEAGELKRTILFASPVAQPLNSLPATRETRVPFLGGKIPWRKEWQPTPVFSPGEFFGEKLGGLQSMGSQRTRHN